MAEQFYTIITNAGKAKIANAIPTGQKLNLTKLKVGDSNGSYYNPNENQTDIKNKVYECNITSVDVDKDNPNWITLTSVIPPEVGGFTIREVGVFDDTNTLIAVGKYPETYKPILENGSTKELYIKMTLEISNTNSIELKVDPYIILATKKDINEVDEKLSSQLEHITKNTTRVINLVEQYGLIGDFNNNNKSGTDNYEKFQQAINDCNAKGGGCLYLPKGNYKISKSLIWKTKVSLVGDGMKESMIYIVNNNRGVSAIFYDETYTINNPGFYFENIYMHDFGINGINVNSSNEYHVWDKAIFIQKIKNSLFYNLYLCDTGATALGIDYLDNVVIDKVFVERAGRLNGTLGASGIGIGTNGLKPENCIISNCIARDCGNYGIFIEGQFKPNETCLDGNNSKGILINNCITTGNKFGFGVLGCNYVEINNCITYKNNGHGLKLYEVDTLKVNNFISDENYYSGVNFSFRTCKNIDFNNCSFTNNKNGIEFRLDYETGDQEIKNDKISFVNCKINNNKGHGVIISNGGKTSGYGSIANLKFKNCDLEGNKVVGDNTNYSGIYIKEDVLGKIYKIVFDNNNFDSGDNGQDYGIISKIELIDVLMKNNHFTCKVGSLTLDTIKGLFYNNFPYALNHFMDNDITTFEGTSNDEITITNSTEIIKIALNTSATLRTLNGGYNLQEISLINTGQSITIRNTSNIKFYSIDGNKVLNTYDLIKLKKINSNWFVIV